MSVREVNIYDKLSNNPIIAAIKDEKDLEAVLESDVEVIFVLQSSLLTIKEVSKKLNRVEKLALFIWDLSKVYLMMKLVCVI